MVTKEEVEDRMWENKLREDELFNEELKFKLSVVFAYGVGMALGLVMLSFVLEFALGVI